MGALDVRESHSTGAGEWETFEAPTRLLRAVEIRQNGLYTTGQNGLYNTSLYELLQTDKNTQSNYRPVVSPGLGNHMPSAREGKLLECLPPTGARTSSHKRVKQKSNTVKSKCARHTANETTAESDPTIPK